MALFWVVVALIPTFAPLGCQVPSKEPWGNSQGSSSSGLSLKPST